MDDVRCIDINDKCLVSGSLDEFYIIWKLPNFKPIKRLKMLLGVIYSIIMGVALYNDYIVCFSGEYIGVWKSSLDNLENQLLFHLQYSLKGEHWYDISINNDIIYSHQFDEIHVIKSWNIGTGQMIQENQENQLGIMATRDQNLFATIYDNQITIWDL